jgi:hypothetical protein
MEKRTKRFYSINEWQLIDEILKTVPRSTMSTKRRGFLPFEDMAKLPAWQKLKMQYQRDDLSIRGACSRRWKDSLIPVEPKPAVPLQVQVQTEKTQPEVHLNHAYNFCPGCGMKLN